MQDAFNSNCIPAKSKENYIIAHYGQPRVSADLWPRAINFWVFSNFLYSRAKQTDHARGMAWTVLSDIFRDLFKVARDEGG